MKLAYPGDPVELFLRQFINRLFFDSEINQIIQISVFDAQLDQQAMG